LQRQNIRIRPAKRAKTTQDTIIAIKVGVARALASAIYGRPTIGEKERYISDVFQKERSEMGYLSKFKNVLSFITSIFYISKIIEIRLIYQSI